MVKSASMTKETITPQDLAYVIAPRLAVLGASALGGFELREHPLIGWPIIGATAVYIGARQRRADEQLDGEFNLVRSRVENHQQGNPFWQTIRRMSGKLKWASAFAPAGAVWWGQDLHDNGMHTWESTVASIPVAAYLLNRLAVHAGINLGNYLAWETRGVLG